MRLLPAKFRTLVALTLLAVLGTALAPGMTRMLGRSATPQLLLMQLCHGEQQAGAASGSVTRVAKRFVTVPIERDAPAGGSASADCPSCALQGCGSAPLPLAATVWSPPLLSCVPPRDRVRPAAPDVAAIVAAARGPPHRS